MKAGVLEMSLLEQVKAPLSAIKPMKAVFDQNFVKRMQRAQHQGAAGPRWTMPRW